MPDVPPQPALIDVFHPRNQRWQAHFAWDERFELIIGLTGHRARHGRSLATQPVRTCESAKVTVRRRRAPPS
jgi:hypothetical protein